MTLEDYEKSSDNDILLLELGEQTVTHVDGAISHEPFWICTTKRFFEEVKISYDVQENEGINVAIDVTYRLSSTNNNLGFIGTTTNVMHEDRTTCYSFVPFAWFFCCTEAKIVYESVYKCIKKWSKLIHDIELDVKYIQQDHCAASAAAADECFPLAIIADCFPHLIRKCREKKSLLHDSALLNNFLEDVLRLHLSCSRSIFSVLSVATIKHWEEQGETEYASWFKTVYLHKRWCNFSIGSLPVGVQPDNNCLESLNKVVKNLIGTNTPFGVLLKVRQILL